MTSLLHLAFVFAVALATRSAGIQGATSPSLGHSAPFLGHVLELTLDGAPPGRSVVLMQSAAAGRRTLPFGTLELDGTQILFVGNGTTGVDGSLRFEFLLPADAALAETESHYQAWVRDPSTAAGAVLSEAVHLRLLGPRAYVGFLGLEAGPDPFPAGLSIVSAVLDAAVVEVDFGAPVSSGNVQGDGGAVFTPSFSRGAVMASPFDLIFFDPFFGGITARVSFDEASPTLLRDSSGAHLFVLETGYPGSAARVHVLDFETGCALTAVDLPYRASGLWDADLNGMAYIAEFHGAGNRTYVRRFGLDDLTVHAAAPVGLDRSETFTELHVAADQLFVGTQTRVNPQGDRVRSEFSRVVLSTLPLTAEVTSFWNEDSISNITDVPDAGVVLFAIFEAFFPGGDMLAAPLAAPGAITSVGTPNPSRGIGDMVARDVGLWALVTSIGGDENEALYKIDDLAAPSWTLIGALPCFAGGVAIDSLRDPFTDRIVYTLEHCGPIGFQDPLLVLHDPATSIEAFVPVGYQPRSLRVVPVP